MSIFPKEKRCQSVKIWSRQEMTREMEDFGITCYRAFQRGLESGDVDKSGCLYSNKFYSAFCKKTRGGMCSVAVINESAINVDSEI